MSRKKRGGFVQPPTASPVSQALAAPEACDCLPVFAPLSMLSTGHQDGAGEEEQMVPLAQPFKQKLRSILEELLPRSTPLSLLLLHVSQWEQQTFLEGEPTCVRRHYHAAPSVLEQVMANICRAIRTGDQMMVHEGICAAMIFPYVDRQGMEKVQERIRRNIDLLQAETMMPPLTRETELLFGIGSYSESGSSLEGLLQQSGRIAHRVVLRPMIATTAWEEATKEPAKVHGARSTHRESLDPSFQPTFVALDASVVLAMSASASVSASASYPFMRLPAELPRRLKQLISYRLACDLRCAPVGRDHHNLTVAMEDPHNAANVRYLQEITGMNIFPVSCEVDELDALLENKW